ncbi:MAG: hypothetical protein RBG13Loki_2765 [Promethearchaeota archaeon CR_4]|nr:MAG: hypothetical protein RBG13Loki_2765 [Candidatus Lokiarchaeota archaeon CR_4]
MDEKTQIADIKRIKQEQTRLRHPQNPSVYDRKLEKRKQKLKQEYWKIVKESR